jgi:hypothetical protein
MMLANKIEVRNRELTPEEEKKINLAKNELQNIKNGRCLTTLKVRINNCVKTFLVESHHNSIQPISSPSTQMESVNI